VAAVSRAGGPGSIALEARMDVMTAETRVAALTRLLELSA
jgi:hypothetical protein